MGATWTTIQNALKEVWSDDHLISQLYNSTPFLDLLEKTDKYNIGEYVQTPITTARTGGTTVVSKTGSTALNPAGNTSTNQAQYSYVADITQVKVELGAIMSSGSKSQSVAEAVDLEVTGAVEETRKQVSRQMWGDQSGLIAKCGTTTTSSTVVLDVTEGYAALVRDFLHPTQTVDIGTTSDPVSVASARQITAVAESESAPTITISGATVSTDATNYVILSGSRSGSTSIESHGLRSIISQTAALGGIAAGGKWQSAQTDTTSTSLTLGLLNGMNRRVRMHTGGLRDQKAGYKVFMSYKQMENFYAELQNQVRFSGDKQLDAGGWEYTSYNGMEIYSEPDIRDQDVFFVNMEDLFLAVGNGAGFGQAGWLSNPGSGGADLSWSQGTTAFVDGYYYTGALCARRRNRMASLTGLTA